MNKIVYIEAHFQPVHNEVSVKVPTGEKKRGLFGGEKDVVRKEKQMKQTGWSDRRIDGQRLADDIASQSACLNEEGYSVISITPVTSGEYNHYHDSGGVGQGGYGYGYGYGYSFTEGVILVAQKAG